MTPEQISILGLIVAVIALVVNAIITVRGWMATRKTQKEILDKQISAQSQLANMQHSFDASQAILQILAPPRLADAENIRKWVLDGAEIWREVNRIKSHLAQTSLPATTIADLVALGARTADWANAIFRYAPLLKIYGLPHGELRVRKLDGTDVGLVDVSVDFSIRLFSYEVRKCVNQLLKAYSDTYPESQQYILTSNVEQPIDEIHFSTDFDQLYNAAILAVEVMKEDIASILVKGIGT